MLDRGKFLGRFRRDGGFGRNPAEGDPVLLQKQEERDFLLTKGAVGELVVKATELRDRFKDVKLGIAKPSHDSPMDIVLSWGEHSPDFKNRPALRAWNTVIIGTTMVGEERRLTINDEVMHDQIQYFYALLTAAVENPFRREFEDTSKGFIKSEQLINQKYFASERQMKGREKIKIKRNRRSRAA